MSSKGMVYRLFWFMHVTIFISLVVLLILGTLIIYRHQQFMQKTPWFRSPHKLWIGIILCVISSYILLRYPGLVSLSLAERARFFTGSEYENWLFFVFPLIPFLWFFENLPNLLFMLVVFLVYLVSGFILLKSYTKIAILYLCAAFILPLVWFLFVWW